MSNDKTDATFHGLHPNKQYDLLNAVGHHPERGRSHHEPHLESGYGFDRRSFGEPWHHDYRGKVKSKWRWLHLLWLPILWMVQYLFVVPTVWLWRYLAVPAFKLGFIGVLLLFIPLIGWAILAWLIFRRKPEVKRDSGYLKPWFGGLL